MLLNPISETLPKVGTPPVVIFLFGTFSVQVNGQPIVSFRSSKARGLLAYLLLMHPQPLLRTTLIDLFWPDYAAESALTSLRQTLANVRSSLKPFDFLHADRHHVHLTIDPTVVWCDTLHFDALLDACQRHTHSSLAGCPACQERLRQALTLYQGPLLHNFPPVDSAPFTNWVRTQQTRFTNTVTTAKTMLAAPVTSPGNLPRPLTSLIGRTTELKELADKALDPVYRCLTLLGPGGIGKTRLAIALGEQLRAHFTHGSWFVALAALPIESRERSEHAELHDRIATAISSALGLTLQGASRPTQQVMEYLRGKTLLLILDNFEHLSRGVDWLVTLLQEAPQVRILVTSRHRLPIQSQLVYPVAGLALPPDKVEESLPPAQFIASYASLQLFVERADNASFPLPRTPSNLAAISALCRLLEGAPLGIELAVALLETQTPNEILHTMRAHYTALQANLGDLPQRHRSAYAVLHTAWALLNAQEAQTLARCSVFRGGFTPTAAQQVIGAEPALLDALVNKSLVHFSANNKGANKDASKADSNDGRYSLHELVRQFAAEQLAQQVAPPVYERHATYYLALLESWQPGAAAERTFRQTVKTELANVESAWAWALHSDLVIRLSGAVPGLAEFYELVNAHHAAEAILQRTLQQVRARLAATPTTSDHNNSLRQLLAALLGRLAYVYAQNLGQPQQAHPLAEEGLTLAWALADARLIGYNSFVRQIVAFAEYDFAQGVALGNDALAVVQAHGLVREQALALFGIGVHAAHLGKSALALNSLTQAIALAQQDNDDRLTQMVRVSLGVTYRIMGDFAQAIDCLEQNLPFLRQGDAQYQIGGSLLNLGLLHLILGSYAASARYIEEGYQMLTALGEKRLASDGLSTLGWLCVQTGEYARAIAYAQRTLALAVSDGAPQVAWLTLGDAYQSLGELENAHAAYTQLIAISQEPSVLVDRWHGQAGLAAVLLGQNAQEEAQAMVDALLLEFDPAQPDALQCPQRVLLYCYRVLAANQAPRAAALLQQAWQLVQGQAEKISNSALRTSFLTNVPVNRTLAGLIAA